MQARPAVLLLRSHHSSNRKQDGSAGSQIEIAAFLLPLPFFLPGVILVGGKRKIAKSVYDIRAHRRSQCEATTAFRRLPCRFQISKPSPSGSQRSKMYRSGSCPLRNSLPPQDCRSDMRHIQQSISACSLFRSLFCIFRSLFLIPTPAFCFSISGIFYSCPSTFTPVSSINGPISYSGIWST